MINFLVQVNKKDDPNLKKLENLKCFIDFAFQTKYNVIDIRELRKDFEINMKTLPSYEEIFDIACKIIDRYIY